jgi:hypothetical protein
MNWIKEKINSIRIPSLLSFFISKDGKIDPTTKEALNEAPPAKNNWERIGLGKKVYGPVEVWMLFATLILVWALDKLNSLTQMFVSLFVGQNFYAWHLNYICDFIFRAPVVAIVVAHLYFLIKDLKK